MSKPTLFDFLNGMTINKTEFDFSDREVNSAYSQYMINRFISMSEIYFPVAREFVKGRLPNDIHYNTLKSMLPKQKIYFPYFKSTKHYTDDELITLSNYYEVGTRDLVEIINNTDEAEVNSILEIYLK